MKTEMNEEEFKNLISKETDAAKHYALMKSFFNECLYEKLGDDDIANQKRNLFINIIYNGFLKENYSDWTINISVSAKKTITNGIKEKRLREYLKKLIDNQEVESIEGLYEEDKYQNFIDELIDKWKSNEQKSEDYYDQIKAKDKYNYLVISEDAPFSGSYLLGDSKEDKKGPYFTPLKSTFGVNSKEKLSDNLLSENVLFFDLLTIPLPISSDLRKKWSTNDNFIIDGKQLPVFLLEVAFDHFDLKYKINEANIAIMMPTKTSACIYNYFEKITEKDYLFCLKYRLTIKSCWKEIEKGYSAIITGGKCFNYYKSNTISGSNTPDADLLKYALSK